MSQHFSISQRLHEKLSALLAGMQPGERLPSEPKLSAQLGVSRATLREAMRTFETQGLIRRRQGSGTYVVLPVPVIESGLEVLESIETQARRIGLAVKMGELKVEHREASPEEANALGLKKGAKILHVSRIIIADGKPAAYLIDILPDDVLSRDDLSDGFTGSVLDLMLKRGSPSLATSRCEINSVVANHDIARAFQIQRGDVLLRFIAWLYTDSGRVVDYSFSYFLPGQFRFHVIRRVGRL